MDIYFKIGQFIQIDGYEHDRFRIISPKPGEINLVSLYHPLLWNFHNIPVKDCDKLSCDDMFNVVGHCRWVLDKVFTKKYYEQIHNLDYIKTMTK